MKKFIVTTVAVVATAMSASATFADTKVHGEPVFNKTSVNSLAKTHLAPAGYETYRSEAYFDSNDVYYEVPGKGASDKR